MGTVFFAWPGGRQPLFFLASPGGQWPRPCVSTNPTTTWVTREAAVDFDYEDLHAEAGTTIHFLTQVSGTDPEAYPNPEIDITAERAPHYGFGGGMHHCLGHFVARADMTIALKVLSAAMTNLRVNGADEWLPDSGNTGPVRLPIAFDKR